MSITGNSSGEPSHEFGLWRREVSWEGGLSHESQRSPVASPLDDWSRKSNVFVRSATKLLAADLHSDQWQREQHSCRQ